MAKKISASVGKGGKNKPEDVQLVQELLNDFTKLCGFRKLDVDGQVGTKTIAAIAEFQKTAVGMARPDSRIDPSGPSFSLLNKGPKKAEAEIQKAKQADKEKQDAKQDKNSQATDTPAGKPQVKGDLRGVDKKILCVLEAVSAHYGKPIYVQMGKQQPANNHGEALWEGWTGKFDRGKRDPNLRKDIRLREELDTLYHDVKKEAFLKLLATQKSSPSKTLAAHAAGHAIDVKRNTDSKVLAALSSILRYEDEGDVIHFDDVGKNIPKSITAEMKKKWK